MSMPGRTGPNLVPDVVEQTNRGERACTTSFRASSRSASIFITGPIEEAWRRWSARSCCSSRENPNERKSRSTSTRPAACEDGAAWPSTTPMQVIKPAVRTLCVGRRLNMGSAASVRGRKGHAFQPPRTARIMVPPALPLVFQGQAFPTSSVTAPPPGHHQVEAPPQRGLCQHNRSGLRIHHREDARPRPIS